MKLKRILFLCLLLQVACTKMENPDYLKDLQEDMFREQLGVISHVKADLFDYYVEYGHFPLQIQKGEVSESLLYQDIQEQLLAALYVQKVDLKVMSRTTMLLIITLSSEGLSEQIPEVVKLSGINGKKMGYYFEVNPSGSQMSVKCQNISVNETRIFPAFCNPCRKAIPAATFN